MKGQPVSDRLAGAAVALLLVLTSWGNATVIFIVAVLGLVVILLITRKNFAWGGVLAATVGCIVAIAISLVELL